jgi:hypothetical protein
MLIHSNVVGDNVVEIDGYPCANVILVGRVHAVRAPSVSEARGSDVELHISDGTGFIHVTAPMQSFTADSPVPAAADYVVVVGRAVCEASGGEAAVHHVHGRVRVLFDMSEVTFWLLSAAETRLRIQRMLRRSGYALGPTARGVRGAAYSSKPTDAAVAGEHNRGDVNLVMDVLRHYSCGASLPKIQRDLNGVVDECTVVRKLLELQSSGEVFTITPQDGPPLFCIA